MGTGELTGQVDKMETKNRFANGSDDRYVLIPDLSSATVRSAGHRDTWNDRLNYV